MRIGPSGLPAEGLLLAKAGETTTASAPFARAKRPARAE